ncbi:MAG: ABC transporter permease, partial [Chloroflexota bacterium]
ALMARLMDFLIAYILLIVLMLVNDLPVFQFNWLFLPLLVIIQLVLALGFGLVLSAMNVFYRDVRHLVVLLLQLWLYATPIIYPVSLVPDSFRPYYFLNPMAGVIEGYRAILFNITPPDAIIFYSAFVSLFVLWIGYFFFKRVEHRFADII